MQNIFKVVSQGEYFTVQSQKDGSKQINKCVMVLRELGSVNADQFLVTLLGNDALATYYPGELVAVSLRFSVREHNNNKYQDILVTDIRKLTK